MYFITIKIIRAFNSALIKLLNNSSWQLKASLKYFNRIQSLFQTLIFALIKFHSLLVHMFILASIQSFINVYHISCVLVNKSTVFTHSVTIPDILIPVYINQWSLDSSLRSSYIWRHGWHFFPRSRWSCDIIYISCPGLVTISHTHAQSRDQIYIIYSWQLEQLNSPKNCEQGGGVR